MLMIMPMFIGTSELLLIAALVLLLFGGKKLPEMMRGMGQGVKAFKDGMNDVTGEAPAQQQAPTQISEQQQALAEQPQTTDAAQPKEPTAVSTNQQKPSDGQQGTV